MFCSKNQYKLDFQPLLYWLIMKVRFIYVDTKNKKSISFNTCGDMVLSIYGNFDLFLGVELQNIVSQSKQMVQYSG